MMVCLVLEREPGATINYEAAQAYVNAQALTDPDAARNLAAATELIDRFEEWMNSHPQFLYLEDFERVRIAYASEYESTMPTWVDLLERVMIGGYGKLLPYLNVKHVIRSTGLSFPNTHDTPMWFS